MGGKGSGRRGNLLQRLKLHNSSFSCFDNQGDLTIEEKIEILDEALLTLGVNDTEDIKRTRGMLQAVLEMLQQDSILARLFTRQALAGTCPISQDPVGCKARSLCRHWRNGVCTFVLADSGNPPPNEKRRPFLREQVLTTGERQRLA